MNLNDCNVYQFKQNVDHSMWKKEENISTRLAMVYFQNIRNNLHFIRSYFGTQMIIIISNKVFFPMFQSLHKTLIQTDLNGNEFECKRNISRIFSLFSALSKGFCFKETNKKNSIFRIWAEYGSNWKQFCDAIYIHQKLFFLNWKKLYFKLILMIQ